MWQGQVGGAGGRGHRGQHKEEPREQCAMRDKEGRVYSGDACCLIVADCNFSRACRTNDIDQELGKAEDPGIYASSCWERIVRSGRLLPQRPTTSEATGK